MNPDELEEKMKKLWEASSRETSLQHKEAEWERFSGQVFPAGKKRYKRWAYAAAVAVVLVAASAGWYSHRQTATHRQAGFADRYVIIENPSALSKIIYLPDSTRIELSPKSRLSYAANFKENRKLTLQGEAFFKVTKDRLHPFSVQCNESKTTVLGTSFTVKSLPDMGVNVQLFEGKVQMELKHLQEGWQLAPGEQFTYVGKQVSVDTFYTDQDFNQVPLEKVLKFLEEKRGYVFQVNPELADKIVTLRIGKRDDIKDISALIATLYKQRFEVNDTTHTIRFYKTESH